MLDADIRFVTSLLTPEFDSYGVQLPGQALADLPTATLEDELDECAKKAAERARGTELKELTENLFYTDLGRVECPLDETRVAGTPTACSEAMRIGLSLVESVACRKSRLRRPPRARWA